MNITRCLVVLVILVLALALLPGDALAASLNQTGLPWESTFDTLKRSLSGPVVQYGSVAAIAGTGLALAFNEGGPVVRQGVKGAFGLSVATGAASAASTLWGVSSGAVF